MIPAWAALVFAAITPQAASPFGLPATLTQGGLALGTAPADTVQLTLDGQIVPLAPDRRFVIAFDRDAAPVAILVARLAGGREVREHLTISPRAWNISRLNRLPKYPVPQPEFQRVRPAELAEIQAARALGSDAQGWRQAFLWPTTGRISTRFGSQRIYAGEPGAFHSGIDIARHTGTPIVAPADGVVILASDRPFSLEGYLLMIDHGMGLNSAFLHLSRIDVKPGQPVRRGQVIGAVGATGRATGAHLHWSMKWRNARIDPLLVTGAMPVTK